MSSDSADTISLYNALSAAQVDLTAEGLPVQLSALTLDLDAATIQAVLPDDRYSRKNVLKVASAFKAAVRPFGIPLNVEVDSDALGY